MDATELSAWATIALADYNRRMLPRAMTAEIEELQAAGIAAAAISALYPVGMTDYNAGICDWLGTPGEIPALVQLGLGDLEIWGFILRLPAILFELCADALDHDGGLAVSDIPTVTPAMNFNVSRLIRFCYEYPVLLHALSLTTPEDLNHLLAAPEIERLVGAGTQLANHFYAAAEKV